MATPGRNNDAKAAPAVLEIQLEIPDIFHPSEYF
jgi:hypothetical protein